MFDRFEAIKQAITDGEINMAMLLADFYLANKMLTQAQFDEVKALVYPQVEQEA